MSLCSTERGYRAHLSNKSEVCPECRLAHREYSNVHRSKNLTKYREANREYKARNQEKVKQYNKEYASTEGRKNALVKYRENHLDDIRLRGRMREHKRRSAKFNGKHTPYTEAQVLDTYGFICHICDGTIDHSAPRKIGIEGWENGLHLDHVIPLAKGGTDSVENVRPSHGKCNVQKNSRLVGTQNF